MGDMEEKKGGTVNARIGTDLRRRLDEISRRWGPTDSTMVQDALSALADYVETSGKYQRPMKMVFDVDADEFQRLQAAEGKAPSVAASAAIRRLGREEKERAEKRPAARK
jgi:hypothetical protein